MLRQLIDSYDKHREAKDKPSTSEKGATPIVQWVGGKRQLLTEYDDIFPNDFETYYEPFAGGAAVMFHLHGIHKKSKNYSISDLNEELIITYKQVRDNPKAIKALVNDMYCRHTKEFYYAVRNIDRETVAPKRYKKKFDAIKKLSQIEIAARFLYLNKTCFNAIYRVNSDGLFNVPIGTSLKKNFAIGDSLDTASKVLRDVDIDYCSYETIEDKITDRDFVFFDPPYAPLNATSNFVSYTKKGFDVKDQKALRDFCARLDNRGVRFAISNSNCELIRELYSSYNMKEIKVNRNLNSKKDKRKKSAEELIIYNF